MVLYQWPGRILFWGEGLKGTTRQCKKVETTPISDRHTPPYCLLLVPISDVFLAECALTGNSI